ncbi:MAG TPA: hypothetical protein ENJ33_00115 [Thiothrix sp.]|nr:hypothetical protein [Thiothrix sp.]
MNTVEIIREDLSATQVMAIRKEELAKGHNVNIRRIHSELVEIEITHNNNVIDITPEEYAVIYNDTSKQNTTV